MLGEALPLFTVRRSVESLACSLENSLPARAGNLHSRALSRAIDGVTAGAAAAEWRRRCSAAARKAPTEPLRRGRARAEILRKRALLRMREASSALQSHGATPGEHVMSWQSPPYNRELRLPRAGRKRGYN